MNRLKRTTLFVLAAVVAVSATLLPGTTNAQESSAALGFTPRKNYTIEAGKSVNDTLLLRNQDTERPLNLSLRVIDFSYIDDSGAPKLMLDEDAPQTTWSMKPFLNIPETVTIEPGESQTLDMSVDIPANQGAGSYYSAIVYSSGAGTGGNIGLSASGVTLVFANVPGETKENLALEKIGAYRASTTGTGGSYAWFMTDMPQRIGYTLKNEGNVTESPVGSITLKPLFGKEVVIQDVNPNKSLALIDQTRTFTPCINTASQDVDFEGTRTEATTCSSAGLWPGYYKVEMTAYYGQNGNNTQDLIGTGGFWYLPWWSILIIIAVVAFVTYNIWKIVRFIRSKRGGLSSRRTPRRK